MAEFDAYHKWFGIPARDQPPHHYRLLGLDPFESDPDVIDAAAEQRMTFLQTCANGPYTALSQELMNEVVAARLCLLDRAKKSLYDSRLQAEADGLRTRSLVAGGLVSSAMPTPPPAPVPVPMPVSPPTSVVPIPQDTQWPVSYISRNSMPAPVRSSIVAMAPPRPLSSRGRWLQPAIGGIAIVTLFAIVVVWVGFNLRGGTAALVEKYLTADLNEDGASSADTVPSSESNSESDTADEAASANTTLRMSPISPIELTVGGRAEVDIDAEGTGFTVPWTILIANLPPHVNSTPIQVRLGQPLARLTVSATKDAQPGTYLAKVTKVAGSAAVSEAVTLHISLPASSTLPIDAVPPKSSSSPLPIPPSVVSPSAKPPAEPQLSPPILDVTGGRRAPAQVQSSQAAWAEHLAVHTVEQNSIGMNIVLIPPGYFSMGSPAEELNRGDDEPRHNAWLTRPYFIGANEVTQQEYAQIMDHNPSYFSLAVAGKKEEDDMPDLRRRPVEGVSWHNAIEFCRRLSLREGQTYRLPTEAEWEFACRAGTTTAFHTGDSINNRQANQIG
ncbi:MAG: formylglycine-generating enzyme family protein, partial [Pirellulales bacterium]